jgi:opacity protein-like surface antigen
MKMKQYILAQGFVIGLLTNTAFGAAPMQTQPEHQPAMAEAHHAEECHAATHKHTHHHQHQKHGHHCAPACPLPMKPSYTGFYVGGQFGYAYTNTGYPCTNLIDGSGSFDRHNTHGWIGGVHGGYGYQFCNCWYVGLDLTADFLRNKDSLLSTNSTNVFSHKVKNSFGVNPRLGYVFKGKGLIYVKVGAQFTRWIHSIHHNALGLALTKSKREPGFAPGLGFSYMMCNNLILGLEATYARYYKEPKVRNLADEDHGFHDRLGNLQFRLSYHF